LAGSPAANGQTENNFILPYFFAKGRGGKKLFAARLCKVVFAKKEQVSTWPQSGIL